MKCTAPDVADPLNVVLVVPVPDAALAETILPPEEATVNVADAVVSVLKNRKIRPVLADAAGIVTVKPEPVTLQKSASSPAPTVYVVLTFAVLVLYECEDNAVPVIEPPVMATVELVILPIKPEEPFTVTLPAT